MINNTICVQLNDTWLHKTHNKVNFIVSLGLFIGAKLLIITKSNKRKTHLKVVDIIERRCLSGNRIFSFDLLGEEYQTV